MQLTRDLIPNPDPDRLHSIDFTAILDPVMVKVEKRMVPLRDLAQVSIKDAKTLMVNVNDPEVRFGLIPIQVVI